MPSLLEKIYSGPWPSLRDFGDSRGYYVYNQHLHGLFSTGEVRISLVGEISDNGVNCDAWRESGESRCNNGSSCSCQFYRGPTVDTTIFPKQSTNV